MSTKCFLVICSVILAIAIYFPARHARHYDYIDVRNVYGELLIDSKAANRSNLKLCEYQNTILSSSEVDIATIHHPRSYHKLAKGGVYLPKTCKALLKVAVIVPYRNRTLQLKTFLNYMHPFLQNQQLEYRIIVVNQSDALPFNRAKMLNYGAKVAMSLEYPCLVLHDVDLIPLSTGNIYACGRKPRHMSSSLDTFRFNLPYLTLFGGAVSLQAGHFQKTNGMSNLFVGWGGEDDDFYRRLEANDLLPYRFAPELSKYTMLVHRKERPSQDRYKNLEYSLERHQQDGLKSLPDNITVKFEELYTLVNAS